MDNSASTMYDRQWVQQNAVAAAIQSTRLKILKKIIPQSTSSTRGAIDAEKPMTEKAYIGSTRKMIGRYSPNPQNFLPHARLKPPLGSPQSWEEPCGCDYETQARSTSNCVASIFAKAQTKKGIVSGNLTADETRRLTSRSSSANAAVRTAGTTPIPRHYTSIIFLNTQSRLPSARLATPGNGSWGKSRSAKWCVPIAMRYEPMHDARREI